MTRMYATVCFGLRALSLYILESEQAEDLSLLYLVNYPFLLSSPLSLFQSLKSLKLTSSIPIFLYLHSPLDSKPILDSLSDFKPIGP